MHVVVAGALRHNTTGGRESIDWRQRHGLTDSNACHCFRLPAAQGVATAKRDLAIPGRTILFEGDGSFQVTCQSLSAIVRYQPNITIFLVNNGGYAYERWLNGMDAEYNDVAAW